MPLTAFDEIVPADEDLVQAVIEDVERSCREGPVYMIGPNKAFRLAELVREAKPKVVLEGGTALGYSGLWIARELKNLGGGKLGAHQRFAIRAIVPVDREDLDDDRLGVIRAPGEP